MYGCAGRGPAWSLAHLLPYSIAKPKAYSAPNVERTAASIALASISPVFSVSSRETVALSDSQPSTLVSAGRPSSTPRAASSNAASTLPFASTRNPSIAVSRFPGVNPFVIAEPGLLSVDTVRVADDRSCRVRHETCCVSDVPLEIHRSSCWPAK